MTEDDKVKMCGGCRNDFYNGKNPMSVKRCWSLNTAKPVVRFKIGTWTQPTQPGAFMEMNVLDCYHKDGAHFYEKLPDFAQNPILLNKDKDNE